MMVIMLRVQVSLLYRLVREDIHAKQSLEEAVRLLASEKWVQFPKEEIVLLQNFIARIGA